MASEEVARIVDSKEYVERYGFSERIEYDEFEKGLSEEVIRKISKIKGEPEWMLEKRLTAYKIFESKPMPTWGADLSDIDFNDIYYYRNPKAKEAKKWEDVPEDIKRTFDKLGVPEAERKFFAGAEAQFDSSVVYSHVNEELDKLGIIFTDTDTAVKKYPELIKKFFGSVIPSTDNKFAALNTAAWSGGSFIYIPKGVKAPMPLNAYFRINAEKSGQFERTLIVADEGADVVYIEGCFVSGTQIDTPDGTKSIEKITVGEYVLTHSGRYKKVYHTQVRPHTGKLYKIRYFGDTSTTIKATDEHPFLAVRKEKEEYKNLNWNPEWIRADTLRKGDYLAIPIDRSIDEKEERTFVMPFGNNGGERELILKTDKDFFRLIGYYLAEGGIIGNGDGNYLTFTFNVGEKEYIDDVIALIHRYFGKNPIVQEEYKGGIGVVLCSTMAARFFKQQFGNGAANKTIPTWVMHESLEKQAELIKGLWRGDGSLMNVNYDYGAKRMFRLNTISEDLARKVKRLLLRKNIFASINMQKRTGNRHTMYCVYVGGENLSSFASVMSSSGVGAPLDMPEARGNILMQMRQIKTTSSYTKIIGDYAFVPIKEISYDNVEDLPVYNFSVEEDESYVAGGVAVHNCTAPVYAANALHSAVVELVAMKGAHIRYVTIQNWSRNVYNLVTQRAHAEEDAHVEWIDANIGSKVNMKYPSIYLKGRNAKGEILSIALAGEGQVQDSGGKVYHLAPDTTSRMVSKSVSKGSGLTTFRGMVYIAKDAENAKVNTTCDALLLDEKAKTNTFPYADIQRNDAMISHEAKVGKISEDEVFYLMSRGIPESDAIAMIVLGFINDLSKILPMEYSLELKRLVKLDMSGSVG